ncbi:hypothetical protein AVEN_21220-1 [Araneus ventricosus]|uniref:Uncharacterized protein n=1 Tax=Araneus ventricosus TaxID=182803 RepID=A0A4Y2C2K0_ARAVE|nr:hypothetical protein AVEN_21220-1 [Araneus ventricosus]
MQQIALVLLYVKISISSGNEVALKFINGTLEQFLPFLMPMVMSFSSSLLHLTCGDGEPDAWHLSDTSDPSRTSVSELVSFSVILGGTASGEREKCQ